MTAAKGADPATGLGTLILRIYLPFAAAYFLSYLYRTVNAVIGPVIARELQLGAADLGLLTSIYFMTFAAIQLPLGVALDRFGPRRVQGVLMFFAAGGAALFGLGDSMLSLTIGRALIGLGVAAGLMAALKAITLWFPPGRWPLLNGLHMAAGGLGSLVATQPAQAALSIMTWHGVFFWLSGITVVSAIALLVVVPEKPGSQAKGSLADQIKAVGRIYRDPFFWRLTPMFVVQQCAFIGIQTLWIGPWLRDVAGQDETTRATTMLLTAAAMTIGFLTSGMVVGALLKRGVSAYTTATVGLTLFIAAHAVVTFVPGVPALPAWLAFGFLGTYVIVYFPVLTAAFPVELSGRVTTCVNFVMFGSIFVAQWGIGRILDLWPRTPSGGYAPEGYVWAFGLFVALQLVALAWMTVFRPKPLTERMTG